MFLLNQDATPVKILLVEDNEADVVLTKIHLKLEQIENAVDVARDGEEALAYFQQGGTPDVMLLDVNLPKLDGYEVLERLEENPQFQTTQVIVLTTSDTNRDIAEKHANRVTAYMTKPLDVTAFRSALL